ncbi:MAG: glycerate kinase [Ignavibacteriaceae bacterium]
MEDKLLNKLREDAVSLFYVGINAASPNNLIPNNMLLEENILTVSDIIGTSKSFELKNYKRIIVIGAGKASTSMAFEVEEILDDNIDEGLVVTKNNFRSQLKRIQALKASHPLPDKKGIEASKKIVEICKNANEDDLIINLISGGASSLLPYRADNITLEDKIKTTKILLRAGATIQELNTLRKHISAIKGGLLAKYVYPATMINLIISDVIGDQLDVIGSGFTVPDPTTFEDSWNVVIKYKLENKIPHSVRSYLLDGMEGKAPETPKPGNPLFNNVHNFIIGNNGLALSAIKTAAEEKGYNARIISSTLEGEAKVASKFIAHLAKEYSLSEENPVCLIFGGETTVTVTGNGKGGRNQEFCLSIAIEIDGMENITFLSGGTDGIDGQTEAAGAICNSRTIERAKELGLNAMNFLDNNDSYNFFKKLDDLIITGSTNTNVMDIQIVLIG